MSFSRIALGHGIGLRPRHYGRFLEERPPVDWLEIISENFMTRGGRPHAILEKVRREVPIVLHGVSLSIGSVDPLNLDYLKSLRQLIDRLEPALVSDHLCWGSFGGHYAHDLLPLPQTEEALTHVVDRVQEVQDRLGRQILLENVSSYVSFSDSTLSEWEFLSEIARRADCGILLDVNNIFVSAHNHGFDPSAYLAGVPGERIAQIHLAGHTDKGTHLLDTHDASVPEAVWQLYRTAVRHFGAVPSLVEWDDQIPALEVVVAEAERARTIETEVLGSIREMDRR